MRSPRTTTKSSPRLLKLEKARVQQWRPDAAKNKNKKFKKRMKRIEDSLKDLWDNIKRTNIQIIGVPEEEEKKKGSEKIFEETSWKLP